MSHVCTHVNVPGHPTSDGPPPQALAWLVALPAHRWGEGSVPEASPGEGSGGCVLVQQGLEPGGDGGGVGGQVLRAVR